MKAARHLAQQLRTNIKKKPTIECVNGRVICTIECSNANTEIDNPPALDGRSVDLKVLAAERAHAGVRVRRVGNLRVPPPQHSRFRVHAREPEKKEGSVEFVVISFCFFRFFLLRLRSYARLLFYRHNNHRVLLSLLLPPGFFFFFFSFSFSHFSSASSSSTSSLSFSFLSFSFCSCFSGGAAADRVLAGGVHGRRARRRRRQRHQQQPRCHGGRSRATQVDVCGPPCGACFVEAQRADRTLSLLCR